jgi:hypothetical protein
MNRSDGKARERVLVCVLAETRAHQATWPGFKKHVLDELGADLALCIGVDDRYDTSNPFWQAARHRWTTREPEDFGVGFDEAEAWFSGRPATGDWRRLLSIRDQWLGGIKHPQRQPGSGGIVIYFRWLLHRHLVEEGLLARYDRFVVTRSDFYWSVPHPPLAMLDPGYVWIPDGERYGGITDRHIVASASDVIPALNLMEEIVARPTAVARSMRGYYHWNVELVIRLTYDRIGLTPRIRFFPYVAFTVRGGSDTTRWSPGEFDEQLGVYVKYDSERELAEPHRWITSAADWEKLAAENPAAFHGDPGPPLPKRTWPYHAARLARMGEKRLRAVLSPWRRRLRSALARKGKAGR